MSEKEETNIQEKHEAGILSKDELSERVDVIFDELLEKRREAYRKMADGIFEKYHDVFEALAKGSE
jgi:hypothetical protein